MPYTLTMGLLWFAVAFVLGLVTGILVRSVVARRQVAAARAAAPGAPGDRRGDEPDEPDEPADRRRATADGTGTAALPPRPTNGSTPAPGVPGVATVAAAEAVLGRPVRPDDLTVVEGLGPAAADLCHGIGIVTWRDLAETEVSLLRTMLDDAGARYQVHDPTTWPTQAALLADGRWREFGDLVTTLRASAAGP